MPTSLIYLFVSLFGLIVGSFITALTHRLPIGLSIAKGRSKCPNCKNKIAWYDNIPVLSFYFLKGKCRSCGNHISLRYPMIEFFTMSVFLMTTIKYFACVAGNKVNIVNPMCIWSTPLGDFNLFFQLIISTLLVSIFVIDLEKKIIPDKLSLGLYATVLLMFVFFNPDITYTNIFVSFASATFFLLVHLLTKGKGMGLGDVKLALSIGILLGWPYALLWLILAFIIGSLVGLFLISLQKTSFGKEIPFGPFLVLSYFLTIFWGDILITKFFKFL